MVAETGGGGNGAFDLDNGIGIIIKPDLDANA